MKALMFLLAGVACIHAAAQPSIETGLEAERTVDGLYRVRDSQLDAAWVRPGVDLSRYSKLLVRRADASLQPENWTGVPAAAPRRGTSEFPATAEQREKLAKALRDEALDELRRGERFQLADRPGHGVLLMVVGLVDVVSHVPPEGPVRGETILHSVSEATLVLELQDSVTGEVLARAADRRAAGTVYMQRESAAAHEGELKRLGGSWGRLLRERLDELIATSEAASANNP